MRFHRPQKYGDSLLGIRLSIEKVVKEKREVHCFEEGRIFNGFRNIYPLFYDGNYIGSVEISFSPKAIAEILHPYFPQAFFGLLLSKELVNRKVFYQERKNYLLAPNKHMYWDKGLLDIEKEHIPPYVQNRLVEILHYPKEGSYNMEHKYVLTLLSVSNCSGQKVGFFLIGKPAPLLLRFYHSYIFYLVSGIVAVGLLVLLLFFLWKGQYEYTTKLREASMKDPLTKLFNRRAFYNYAKTLPSRWSIIYCDIDYFKKINDLYGHEKGDEVLKHVAALLQRYTRASDFVVRWGGEEFLIVLPSVSLTDALHLAKRLRKAVHNAVEDLRVSCSFGVAEHEEQESIDETVKRADEALYKAKESGRDRIELSKK